MSSMDNEEAVFDWGHAALKAIAEWKEAGSGGAIAFDFPWNVEGGGKKTDVA